MNRLQFESSPYLLQHKDNPVDWYPWGEEAFRKAREENKPILLSIGYSSCHWCHVMAHESFENPQIAEIMNDLFVNIKVDREERPDVDSLYMNFVQLTTGSGGWPLTVFLTPELLPFYGGTYFPPEDRYGKAGFVKILFSVSDAYNKRLGDINSQKQEIINSMSSATEFPRRSGSFIISDFNKSFSSILRNYDEENGGFGNAPKFPSALLHMFLLRYYVQTGNKPALEIVENSLTKMAEGGIFDQIGGGFHRYSTDNRWLVPHFEKMLYDNALLARVYLETYQLTNDKFYLTVAENTLNYILQEMTSDEGGFYSAQDADSEGVEGKFFLWDKEELKSFLTEEEFDSAVNYFHITVKGNFEGKNILTAKNSIDEIAGKRVNVPETKRRELSAIKKKMYKEREKRIHPALDNKILTNWNALMLYSFAIAYGITSRERYYNAAITNAEFLWNKCFNAETLMHSYKDGKAKIEGYLDDYAFLAEAFIMLYEVTSDEKWILRSDKLMSLVIDKFYSKETNDFYFTTENQKDLIIRNKEFYDNVIPSGNSSAVMALLKLSVLLNKQDYYNIAEKDINYLHDVLIKYPESFSYLLTSAYYNFIKPDEVALIADSDLTLKSMRKEYFKNFLPFSVFSSKVAERSSEIEPLKGKTLVKSPCTIYLCRNYACQMPVFSIHELLSQIRQNSRALKT
ncbi:MAG: thioredoxin domain-containing protein [Bacteroidota bacterium]|nr:thioredoxin domain-containing protein [Bacteroidota bacterium]